MRIACTRLLSTKLACSPLSEPYTEAQSHPSVYWLLARPINAAVKPALGAVAAEHENDMRALD